MSDSTLSTGALDVGVDADLGTIEGVTVVATEAEVDQPGGPAQAWKRAGRLDALKASLLEERLKAARGGPRRFLLTLDGNEVTIEEAKADEASPDPVLAAIERLSARTADSYRHLEEALLRRVADDVKAARTGGCACGPDAFRVDYAAEGRAKAEAFGPKMRVVPDPDTRPIARIVGSLLIVESGDDTVETRICIPPGGLPYDALLAALPDHA